MVASPAFSEPKHRLNCLKNKSEEQSKSYCFGSGLLENRYTSVFKDLAQVRHVFPCIQKLKYAAAYFAYTVVSEPHVIKGQFYKGIIGWSFSYITW